VWDLISHKSSEGFLLSVEPNSPVLNAEQFLFFVSCYDKLQLVSACVDNGFFPLISSFELHLVCIFEICMGLEVGWVIRLMSDTEVFKFLLFYLLIKLSRMFGIKRSSFFSAC